MGDSAFRKNKLTSITLGEGIISIEKRAFGNTENGGSYEKSNQLTSVTIPDSVNYIGEFAFDHNKLTTITIPNGITYIGKGAFNGNPLTSVTFNRRGTKFDSNNSSSYYPTFNDENNLIRLYENIGEGTYIKTGSIWSKKP